MQLWDWLLANQVPLRIDIMGTLNPFEGAQEWCCLITGFPDPTETRPAVFLRVRKDPVSAVADNPEDAVREAIHKLRGVKVGITSKNAERDETLTFPQDLTV
jgi:hypothetical protein